MDMDMDSDHNIHSDMTSVSESNLGSVLFSDYSSGNLILTSDISAGLSSFEGTLCFDETNNELVYVNMPVQMISSSIGNSDSITNQNTGSAFSSYGAASISSLSDLPLLSDGGQVMLFAGGSIVIPSDEENLIPSNSDPFILEYVLNGSQSEQNFADYKAPVTIDFTDTLENDIKQKRKKSIPGNCDTMKNSMENIEKKKNNDYKKNTDHWCKLCLEKFDSLKDYKKHLFNHKDHKMHECKLCGVSFNKINNLVLHEVTHSNDTKCPLLSCQKKFNRKASLKAHVKLHEEDESLMCPECGEEFRNQLYLELHYKYQSQCRISSFEPATSPSHSRTFLCKLCDRDFERIETFNAHKKEHEKLKKALATKSHKKKSASTVPSSRINRCKMCPKWFLKPSQLVRHMRIHTGERPFVCNVCNKAFNQANSLKIHMLKHTGDRPFQCPFCGTSFSQRGNLRQHINRVHSIPRVEEKVYKCSECPCMFKKMCSLNAHKNRVHQQHYSGPSVKNKSASNQGESVAHLTEGTAITIENGVDDVNDEDMTVLLDKDSDINTISINFDNGNGTICNQKVFVKKTGNARYYRCSHCPKENVKLKEIIRHLKFSVLGKPFKCHHCSKTFLQRSAFSTHLTLHATAETYQCAVCDRSFTNPLEMKIHSKLHTEMIERQNSISLVTNLDARANSNVADAAKEQNCRVSERARLRDTVNLILPPYDCKFCQTRFESYTKLKQHLRSVHDVVICQKCCLQFRDKTTSTLEKRTNANATTTASPRVLELPERLNSKSSKKLGFKKRRECQLCGKVVATNEFNKLEITLGEFQEYHADRRLRIPSHSSAISLQKFSQPDTPSVMVNEINNDTDSCGLSLPIDGDNADDIPTSTTAVESSNVGVNHPFTTDGAVTIYVPVPCDLASSNNAIAADAATSIDQVAEISITNDGDFSASNTVSTATVIETLNAAMKCSEAAIDESPLFGESQINANENAENSAAVTDGHLKTELRLTLNSMEDSLFEFQSVVVPIEMNHEDAAATSNDLLNSAGAVIYKSTKCFSQSFVEFDAEKQYEEIDCVSGDGDEDIDTINSYFYACNTCYLTFKNLPTLLKHLQTHDGTKSFECLYCGTENKTQAQLTHHIAQHSLQKEFPCVHCGELFDSLDVVKKHITDIHLMSSVDKKSEQKRKKNSSNDLLLSEKQKIQIACQKPHKYSSISERVLSSLLKNNAVVAGAADDVDENAKNYARAPGPDKDEKSLTKKNKNETKKMQKENICSYCSRGFKKMCDLVRHIRIHTGEKPFKCDYCSKCFTVKSILNCHLKTHFSVNNIFCHVCNRFFATVGSLKTHMRLHTGERPYKCLYCKETFRTSGHRDSHQKRHLGGSGKDKAAKWMYSAAESALIEIENTADAGTDIANELDADLETVTDSALAPDAEVETEAESVFILPHNTCLMDDEYEFKFQGMDLSELSGGVPTTTCSTSDSNTNTSTSRGPNRSRSQNHSNSHSHTSKRSPAPHCCRICRKVFKRKSDLDRHFSIHAKEKAFRCEICDMKFSQENSLKLHLRKHTQSADETWPCEQCGSAFVSAKTLKMHKVRRHPETLNLPVKDHVSVNHSDENGHGLVEIVEVDKDVTKWRGNGAGASAEIFADKMVDLKKYDATSSDFYVIDKHFDLNTMMRDLFPDDEKQ